MKNLFAALFAFIAATPAFAHIEPGTWTGKSAAGQECSMVVYEQTFERDMHHPLNERIRVKIGAEEFKIYHPRSIDTSKNVVNFNHDLFEGVSPTTTGSNALVIEMVHTEEFEGPSGYRWIEHNWKTKSSRAITCLNLKHVRTGE